MAKVSEIVKNQHVVTVPGEASVLEVSRMMAERNIGAVAVMRDGELIGIFSERDVLTRVVAAGRAPGSTRIREVMTANPRTVSLQLELEECAFMMREHGFRHLPVLEGKALKGIISLRDIAFFERGPKAMAAAVPPR